MQCPEGSGSLGWGSMKTRRRGGSGTLRAPVSLTPGGGGEVHSCLLSCRLPTCQEQMSYCLLEVCPAAQKTTSRAPQSCLEVCMESLCWWVVSSVSYLSYTNNTAQHLLLRAERSVWWKALPEWQRRCWGHGPDT